LGITIIVKLIKKTLFFSGGYFKIFKNVIEVFPVTVKHNIKS